MGERLVRVYGEDGETHLAFVTARRTRARARMRRTVAVFLKHGRAAAFAEAAR